MGRKPNPLILNYFERGPKLNDNSNRYPHRCKACGEDFPKGRIDSLTAHLTKKCPAISKEDRVEACLALHGMSTAAPQRAQRPHNQPNYSAAAAPGLPLVQNTWTALETLAEVSRQIDLSEKHDDHTPNSHNGSFDATHGPINDALLAPMGMGSNPFELQEQFTLENPPMSYDNRLQRERDTPQHDQHDLTTEEKLRNLLQADGSPENSNLSVAAAAAAAATARLHPSLLDPQLQILTDGAIPESGEVRDLHQPQADELIIDLTSPERTSTPATGTPVTTDNGGSPWGEMTYIPDAVQAPAIVSDQSQQLAFTLNKGGFRMDTSSLNGSRHRHTRARFDSNRRREVQEVRRIGACIRCRILRKTCSKGTPCDTCRKVLSPRVWRTGCTRTKLAEQIELYSAGVQIVLSQKRVNKLKAEYNLVNNGVVIEAAFHETGQKLVLQVLQGSPKVDAQSSNPDPPVSPGDVIMVDNDREDIPAKVENYMRQVLPELILREPSNYVRVTLECAAHVAQETNDELLRRSLELWGLVEMMHRERHWSFVTRSNDGDDEGILIKDDVETFTNLSMQLTGAAERKASSISKSLLNGIQRNLQDGKTKLGFPMFLTAMVFLNCVEKTTWTFKAWEGEDLRLLWPLEKEPKNYYQQSYGLCDLLRMLLLIRHILPKVSAPDPDRPILAEEESELIRQYYQDLNVSTNFLQSRHSQFTFDQSDSRSLEFLFCSALLMP